MSELTKPSEEFLTQIHVIRGQRVMLDFDLAANYGVTTARLNQQVRRNLKRFPPDFMFQLTKDEFDLMLQNATSNLKSQNAISNRGGRRKLPLAFTEHGAVMAASVLNTDAAIQASIYVVKAFVQMRNVVGMYRELEQRLSELEEQFSGQGEQIQGILGIIEQFVQPVQPRKRIGFKRNGDEG